MSALEPGLTSMRRPQRPTAGHKALPFLLGLFLFLSGVLVAWLLRAEEAKRRSEQAAAAWIGCLLSPLVWLVLIVVFTFGVVPIGWAFRQLGLLSPVP